jgi:integrase
VPVVTFATFVIVADVRVHDLRHSFASFLVNAWVAIMKWYGRYPLIYTETRIKYDHDKNTAKSIAVTW